MSLSPCQRNCAPSCVRDGCAVPTNTAATPSSPPPVIYASLAALSASLPCCTSLGTAGPAATRRRVRVGVRRMRVHRIPRISIVLAHFYDLSHLQRISILVIQPNSNPRLIHRTRRLSHVKNPQVLALCRGGRRVSPTQTFCVASGRKNSWGVSRRNRACKELCDHTSQFGAQWLISPRLTIRALGHGPSNLFSPHVNRLTENFRRKL
jgi:hypothetical protein